MDHQKILFKKIQINQIEDNERQINTSLADLDKIVIKPEGKFQINEQQQKIMHENFQKFSTQTQQNPQNQDQNYQNWSHYKAQVIVKGNFCSTLKSNGIKVSRNQTQITKQIRVKGDRCWQFSLFQVGFTRQTKNIKCWSFKIKEKTGGMDLGLCSKNILLKNQFKYQDINWFDIGHGLYVQGSTGCCYNNELKDLNHVQKSFGFKKGDVIHMQYDPIEQKIRFKKNQEPQTFEMPIPLPQPNDVYHPCVAFYQQNDSVELILPRKNF